MLTKIVLLAFLVACVQGCIPQAPANSSQRSIKISNAELTYSPARLTTESPLALDIEVPADWQLQTAKMTGISMEMPVMPLFFNKVAAGDVSHAVWQTQFLIGACADAQMTWRLELVFHDQSGLEQRLTDEFLVFRR